MILLSVTYQGINVMTGKEIEKVRNQKNALCDAKVYVPPKLSTTATFDSYITQVTKFLAQNEIDELKTMSSSFKSLTNAYNVYLNTIPLSRSTTQYEYSNGKSGKHSDTIRVTVLTMYETLNRAIQRLDIMTPATKIRRSASEVSSHTFDLATKSVPLDRVQTVATYNGTQYTNLKNCCDKINSEVKRINDKIKDSKDDRVFSFELFCRNS